jgi:hypothetical protein
MIVPDQVIEEKVFEEVKTKLESWKTKRRRNFEEFPIEIEEAKAEEKLEAAEEAKKGAEVDEEKAAVETKKKIKVGEDVPVKTDEPSNLDPENELEDEDEVEELRESILGLEEAGELKENCHFCGNEVAHLDKHILTNHGEEVECQLCGKTFPVSNLRRHILKKHCRNKVTKCTLCEKRFVNKSALKNRIKQIHLSETPTYRICHKKYKDLYYHVKYVHEKIRSYECSYCEKRFQTMKLMYNHVHSIHMGEKTNCPVCGKVLTIPSLNEHVESEHKEQKKGVKIENILTDAKMLLKEVNETNSIQDEFGNVLPPNPEVGGRVQPDLDGGVHQSLELFPGHTRPRPSL